MHSPLNPHVSPKIKFKWNFESIPQQLIGERVCELRASLEIKDEMHDFLGLLAKFLILVNHDSLCIYLVKLSHTHNIDVLR